MCHRKLSASETAGTYRPSNRSGTLEHCQGLRSSPELARGRKITQPALAFEYL